MAQSSEQRDLDRLVREHLPSALRFAVRLTGDPDAAEDLVQESLVRAARSWKSYRGDAEFRTWFFRIVINVFRDHVARRPPPDALTADVVDTRSVDPQINSQQLELGRLIASRVSSLPPRQREVMVLIAYEGLTPEQAAGVLAITPANVHATLRLARARLRTELAPYFVER
jgi:RNA polymerase sigma-70 factor (ECF subfamily)